MPNVDPSLLTVDQRTLDNYLRQASTSNDPNLGAPGSNVAAYLMGLSTLGSKGSNTIGSLVQQAQGVENILPGLQGAINAETLPTALSNLQASEATSPGYANLMASLYGAYGPLMNQIGSNITGQNMANYVGNQNAILQGPGSNLLQSGYNASQIFDAPYYQARQATADSLGKLLNSIDVSGNLSGSETNQIGQGLARQDVQKGTLNAPSQADIVSNAMQYGNAAFQRKATEQGILSNAINTASSFLPQSKSGVNVFNTGTGVGVGPNPGNNLFTGINTNFGTNIGSQAFGQAGQIGNTDLAGQYGIDTTQMNIKANAKDWMDYLEQSSQIFHNIAGGAAGMAGMCWVAREIYGADNSTWLQFRNWLLTKAPKELRDLYLQEGEYTSSVIKDKPLLKYIIKEWMDSKLNNN